LFVSLVTIALARHGGRKSTNRIKACEIAGIEPKFQKINGQDQKAYILSVNVNRRHMTAAQRAMATAMIYPSAPRGRGKKGRGKTGSRCRF
jgi:hypothetical protein